MGIAASIEAATLELGRIVVFLWQRRPDCLMHVSGYRSDDTKNHPEWCRAVRHPGRLLQQAAEFDR